MKYIYVAIPREGWGYSIWKAIWRGPTRKWSPFHVVCEWVTKLKILAFERAAEIDCKPKRQQLKPSIREANKILSKITTKILHLPLTTLGE